MMRIACIAGIFSTLAIQAEDTASAVAQEARLAELRQVYTENHPYIRQAKAELEHGRRAGNVDGRVLSHDEAVAAQEARLAKLQEVYTDKHPAVRKAKSDLEILKQAQEKR